MWPRGTRWPGRKGGAAGDVLWARVWRGGRKVGDGEAVERWGSCFSRPKPPTLPLLANAFRTPKVCLNLQTE
ncbi:hypothetical protein E2C01_093120 [Portunus trituberculatus]|uniref:Uncharacterized protein n=1 Tax=Portunus trituberculatus TaxID=210409 RepID=A0A5B7JXS5_PORTR|nr:hypothetical protein [Portunus trituberculatus]